MQAQHGIGRRDFLAQMGLVTGGMLLADRLRAAPSSKRQPNIILIYTDDQDFDELSPYDAKAFPCATGAKLTGASTFGGCVYSDPRMLTPNMQRMADEGVTFNRFYITSSVCTPSRYSTLTGRYASRCPWLQRQAPPGTQVTIQWNTKLGPEESNVAKAMKRRGYATGLVGKWHNHAEGMRPKGVAWDSDPKDPVLSAKVEACYQKGVTYLKGLGFDYVSRIWNGNKHDMRVSKALGDNNLEWITEGAIEFMEANKDKPFFLYMPLTVPHGSYSANFVKHDMKATTHGFLDKPPQSGMPSRQSVLDRLNKAGIDKRNAMGTWLDDCLGAMLRKISDLDLDENTAVFFISDHQSRGKYACYEGCRVPALARWPGHIKPKTQIDALCANIDLAPTFMAMGGQEASPADGQMDGASFLPLLPEGHAPADWRRELLLEVSNIRAVVTERWKLIANRPTPEAKEALDADAAKAAETGQRRVVGWDGKAEKPRKGRKVVGVRFRLDSHFPAYFDPDQLYDLDNDVFEQKNVASDPANATVVADLKKRLSKVLAPLPHAFAEFKPATK